jgi:hypothetical protein
MKHSPLSKAFALAGKSSRSVLLSISAVQSDVKKNSVLYSLVHYQRH